MYADLCTIIITNDSFRDVSQVKIKLLIDISVSTPAHTHTHERERERERDVICNNNIIITWCAHD